MIGKDEVLIQMEKLMERQKALVSFLGSHLSSSVNFSGLKKNDIEDIQLFFKTSVVEQKKHLEILEEVYRSLRESKQHVF